MFLTPGSHAGRKRFGGVITSNSSTALAVGPFGTVNPVLQVDASTALSATGIKITGAASGAGVAIVVVSPSTNDALTINAKGTGAVSINGTATGNINLAAGGGQVRISGANGTTPQLTFANDNLSGFGNRNSTSFDFSAFANATEVMRWTTTQITTFSTLSAQSTLNSNVTRTIASASLEAGSLGWADVEVVGSTTTISGSTNVNSFALAKTQFDAPVLTASAAAVSLGIAATVYIAGAPTTSSSGGFTPSIVSPYALYVSTGNALFGGRLTNTFPQTIQSAASISWGNFVVSGSTLTLIGTNAVTGAIAQTQFTSSTITDSSACIVTSACTVGITGAPVAGGSVTLTNAWALNILAGNVGLPASGYLNFGTTSGTSGYGFRDNGGVPEVKSSGGSWNGISGSAVLFVDAVAVSSGATTYFSIFKGTSNNTEASVGKMYLPRAGTLKNLRAACYLSNQGAATLDIYVRVNGTDSALTVQIPSNTTTGTVTSDTTHTVTVAAGDYVVVKGVQGAASSGFFAVSFEYA